MYYKKKLNKILNELDKQYPDTKCYLNYEKDWQLIVATILSAQCTDDRVNKTTPELFEKYQTINDLANANLNDIEKIIKPTGFFHNKAKNILLMAKLLSKQNGKIPSDINELIKFPGIGRKTANVIRSHIFNLPSIVVDTHVKRVSKLLGLTKNSDPTKVEYDLMEILPKEHWIRFNTQIIAHGRKICKARKPECDVCFLNPYCESYNKGLKKDE